MNGFCWKLEVVEMLGTGIALEKSRRDENIKYSAFFGKNFGCDQKKRQVLASLRRVAPIAEAAVLCGVCQRHFGHIGGVCGSVAANI